MLLLLSQGTYIRMYCRHSTTGRQARPTFSHEESPVGLVGADPTMVGMPCRPTGCEPGQTRRLLGQGAYSESLALSVARPAAPPTRRRKERHDPRLSRGIRAMMSGSTRL